ncbi:unnamed protein product, partial [Meganyctiphanes norvegica]
MPSKPMSEAAGIATGRVLGMMAEAVVIAIAGGRRWLWRWWLQRVLAADGDGNTYYLVLDLMAITASSPMAANTVSCISSPLSNLDLISLARLGSSGTLMSSRMSP